jgi:hypothetical protein
VPRSLMRSSICAIYCRTLNNYAAEKLKPHAHYGSDLISRATRSQRVGGT